MRGMIRLRLAATASNLCFIAYGASLHLFPILTLHILLLPLNIWRMLEIFVITRSIKSMVKIDCLQALGPYLRAEHHSQGVLLFKKGDIAQCMYLVSEGELIVEEIGHVLRPTDLFGEMALFSPTRRRTFSVRTLTNATVFAVAKYDVESLCLRRPELAYYLITLITGRLVQDLEQLRSKSSEDHARCQLYAEAPSTDTSSSPKDTICVK